MLKVNIQILRTIDVVNTSIGKELSMKATHFICRFHDMCGMYC
jgi:hypothetical protein